MTRSPILDPLKPTAVASGYVSRGGYIRGLAPGEVNAATADVALSTADAVVKALDLPRGVTVNLYRPCAADHPDAAGPMAPIPNGLCTVTSTDEIWIRADMTPPQTKRVVAHELRHLWQNLQGLGAFSARADRERDAYQFDLEWTVRNP